MTIKKVRQIIKEIDLLDFIDDKFKVGYWYKEMDDDRKKEYIYKVTGIDKRNIYFKSIDGEMEEIDPQDTKAPSFHIGSLTYERSIQIPKKDIRKILENHIESQFKIHTC